jgi:hypothetical protein
MLGIEQIQRRGEGLLEPVFPVDGLVQHASSPRRCAEAGYGSMIVTRL